MIKKKMNNCPYFLERNVMIFGLLPVINIYIYLSIIPVFHNSSLYNIALNDGQMRYHLLTKWFTFLKILES